MQTRDYTPSTDPAAIAAFRQALHRARRDAAPRPRVVDRTAEFRRLRMGLPPRPRGEDLELRNLPA